MRRAHPHAPLARKARRRFHFRLVVPPGDHGRALWSRNSSVIERGLRMLKKLMLSTALSAAVATGAFAQSPSTPSSSTPAPAAQLQGYGKANFVSPQKPDQWLASKFKGTDVIGSDNRRSAMSATSCSTEREGRSIRDQRWRFPRHRLKEAALAPNSFDVVPDQNGSADKLKLAVTKGELKNAQAFARYGAPRPTSTTGSGNSSVGGGLKPSGSTRPASR